jgi:signal transduction histidine kinase
MYYQDIPFLIWSPSSKENSQRISRILGRKSNTFVCSGDTKAVQDFLEKIEYFSCNIFHVENDRAEIDELIRLSLKIRPLSPVILFFDSDLSFADHKSFIKKGVTDTIVAKQDDDKKEIRECLVSVLNHRWKIFRYLEKERNKIYHATVVTAYHELNQPLTVILNTIGLFDLEMEQNDIDMAKTKKLLDFILKSIRRIQELLTQLQKIKQPVLKEYTRGVPMIHLQRGREQPEDETQIIVKPNLSRKKS